MCVIMIVHHDIKHKVLINVLIAIRCVMFVINKSAAKQIAKNYN